MEGRWADHPKRSSHVMFINTSLSLNALTAIIRMARTRNTKSASVQTPNIYERRSVFDDLAQNGD